jgi:osmotically inducible protein OsmC
VQLTIRGEVDGIGEDEFRTAADQAKDGCPVSNALGGVEILLDAALER